MLDDSKKAVLAKLLLIKKGMIQHSDYLSQLSNETSANAVSNAPYIEHIQQGNALLRQEILRLLDNPFTEEQLGNMDFPSWLSKIRHDLRNPINAMLGYAEISLEELQLSKEEILSNKMEEVIDVIRKILALIDDININSNKVTSPKKASQDKLNVLTYSNLDKTISTEQENMTQEFLQFKEEIPILIVDDIKENCNILTQYLNHIGYKNIKVAYNGREALEIIENHSIEIVLLDIDMPEMTGIEVLVRIKSHARFRNIMVMMISAADSMENTIQCIKLGAEDFLPKPFNRDLLNVRMSACVEKKWFQNKEIQYNEKMKVEKQRYEQLLNVILPPSIVTELATENQVKTKYYQNVAVLFTDVVSFTTYCDTHELSDVEKNLQKFSEICEDIAIKHNLQKIKTIGDAFLATSGMLIESKNPVLDCLSCASELLESSVKYLPAKWKLRAGIDFGTVIGGIIGHRQFLFDIWGDTVNTASRTQNAAEPDSIFLTKNAYEKIQDHSRFASQGVISLKGKAPMELFKYLGTK